MQPHSAPIRVLVVEDHDLFRTGLVSFLGAEPDIEVVGQASGGHAGVRLASQLRPSVVLMDIRMPDLDGTDATRLILQLRPETKVVALTVANTDDDIASALRAGCCAFLAKDTPVRDIATAVRAAASGVAWLSPRAADSVLGRIRNQTLVADRDPAIAELSEREVEVLRLLARGLGNSEIASALSISPSTAKNHVSSILTKLGLPNRIQAAVYAIRNDIE